MSPTRTRNVPTIHNLCVPAVLGMAFLFLATSAYPSTPTICPAAGGPCPGNAGGPVLRDLKIINLYMSSDWNSDNSGFNITRENINTFTQNLVNSDYFAAAKRDYGINSATYGGAYDATGLARAACLTPSLGGWTDFAAIDWWITCMAGAGPSPVSVGDLGIRPTAGNIPAPDDNTLYVIYVPKGTNISDFTWGTCDNYGAYHFFTEVPKWYWDWTGSMGGCAFDFCKPLCCAWYNPPGPHTYNQRVAYAVVPAECSNGNLDELTVLATHEIMEAATDPIPPTGWIDSTMEEYLVGTDMLIQGEVADICSSAGAATTPSVKMSNGTWVAPYWSTSAVGCYPHAPLVQLDETGLPSTVRHEAVYDGNTVPLPFSKLEDIGSTHNYSFPATVNDPNPGIRYVTAEPSATLTVTADFSKSASYSTQYYLTVQAAPPAAASLDSGLTQSAWIPGMIFGLHLASLSTSPSLPIDQDSQYRFDRWSGDVAGSNATMIWPLNGPTSAIANYVLQHKVTVRTNGLGANTARIFNGSTLLGTATDSTALTTFVDDGPLTLNADAVVTGSNGVPYSFKGFNPTPPATLAGTVLTTATYTVTPTCAPNCGSGAPCGANSDCSSKVCASGTCQAPTCSPRCGQGAPCSNNGDCSSFVCGSTNTCVAPSCSPRCDQGAPCGASSDCGSKVCTNGLCQAPTCSPQCSPGAACNNSGDCSSYVCSPNNTCSAPGCSPNCGQGTPCGVSGDCLSKVCSAGLCKAPACSPNCSRAAACGNNNDCKSHVCNNGVCN